MPSGRGDARVLPASTIGHLIREPQNPNNFTVFIASGMLRASEPVSPLVRQAN